MSEKKKKTAIRVVCVMLALAIVAGIAVGVIANQKKEEPLYTVTYTRVGGTDECPIYAMEFTWLGDEPLVIDSNGWHIGE